MNPIAAHVDDISTEWLAHILGAEVDSIESARIGGGQMAATYRLLVRFSDPEQPPRRIIAKLAAADPRARAMVADGYRKEIAFYRDLAPTTDIVVPTCHYAAISDDRQSFTLLLEDIGDDLAGSHADGADLTVAFAAVVNLAGLHASRWSDPTLLELRYLRPANAAGAAMAGAAHITATESFCARYQDRLSPLDIETMRDAARTTEAWYLASPTPFAPLHGDYRLDNMMVRQTGEIVTVDWQGLSLGPPTRDLAFFVATSLDSQTRRLHERALVAAYHAALAGRGVAYDEEQCFEDYRIGQLSVPFVTVMGSEFAVARTEASDEMFVVMATRACAAIRDLDSIGRVQATQRS